jgi:hypothetical protein
VQQAVDAAEIDEGAVLGDVLDHAVDDLTLFEVRDQLGALLGPAFLEDGAARHDDVAAAAIHLEDLEGLRRAHQGRHVAHGTDVDLGARQERDRAVEIDRVAALDLVEDDAGDALVGLEGPLELDPAFLAARLVARDDGLTERVLDALQIDLDLVADLERLLAAAGAEKFLEGDAALGLGADVDDATSFSIATTVPLTTAPSATSDWPKDSSSRAAKSSRLGARCCATDIRSP